jgi:hypothetical protein
VNFSENKQLESGWQHLLPLTSLQWLDLRRVNLPWVCIRFQQTPPELAALPLLRIKGLQNW